MHNVALKFLKEAAKLGWTFKVGGADDGGWTSDGYDYEGNGPVAAWNAVKEVTEEWVEIYDGNTYLGVVFLMTPGPLTCAPDETLADWNAVKDGPLDTLAEKLIEEVL